MALIQILLLAFVIEFSPFPSRFENAVQLINDVLIQLYIYSSILITDYNYNPDLRELAGWLMLGIILINAAFNIGIFFTQVFKALITKYKQRITQKVKLYNLN